MLVVFWFRMDLPMHPGERFCLARAHWGGVALAPGQALPPSGSVWPAQAQGLRPEAHLSVLRTQTQPRALSMLPKHIIQTLRRLKKGVCPTGIPPGPYSSTPISPFQLSYILAVYSVYNQFV